MIPIIGYTESLEDFTFHSVEMRVADSPELRAYYAGLFDAQAVRYIGRGYNNGHHLVSCERAPVLVRRSLFPVPVFETRLRREYRFLSDLAAAGYGYAPTVHRWLEPSHIDDAPAFAMSWIAGENRGLDLDCMKGIGEAVRELHALPVAPDPVGDRDVDDPQAIVARMIAAWRPKFDAIAAGMQPADRRHLAHVLERLPERFADLDLGDERRALLHGDLGDHNYLRRPCDSRVMLIDWEFAAVSHPLLDLMWLYNRPGFSAQHRASFESAYGGLPQGWEEPLELLRQLCTIEDVIWAQSGLQDIEDGINDHYFSATDTTTFIAAVARIHSVPL